MDIDWKTIAGAAERDHGILTRDQLLAAGLSDRQLTDLKDDGRLVPLGYGVYRWAGVPATFEGDVLAAIRRYPDQVWAARFTMARLMDLDIHGREQRIEILRPTGLSAQRSTARVHRTSFLPDHHVTTIRGIPCTTAARGLFDMAATTRPVQLRRGIDRALHLGHCTMGALYRVHYELGGRGRPGTKRMRSVLDTLDHDHVPAESELEFIGMALLADLGFEWQVQISDEQGYIRRVDGLHRAARVVLELDGKQHDLSSNREADRAGDARLRAMGFEVVRLRWHDVSRGGEATRSRVVDLVTPRAA